MGRRGHGVASGLDCEAMTCIQQMILLWSVFAMLLSGMARGVGMDLSREVF